MQSPVFARPIDNPSGVATLAAPYVPGVGTLALDDAGRLGSPSPSAPVRLTIYQDASFGAILGQFLATARAGNLVTVAVDAGFPDAPLPAGSVVGVAIGAAALAEVQAAILAAVGAITALQGAAGGVSSVAGRTGAVVLSTGDVAGLGTAATHAAADFLAPDGSGALLTGLNASALAAGTVAPARLGAGVASASTFLRGDGTWSAPPSAPVTTVAGRTGAVTLSTADVGGLAAVAASGAYGDLSGRPMLATVATTGSYSDLTNRPALGTLAGQNGTFSGTHSGSSSGTNTGDQTDIPGQAGTVATIAGRIVAGSNVTIAGAGTAASPYSISAPGGGSIPAIPAGSIAYGSGGSIAGASSYFDPATGNLGIASDAPLGRLHVNAAAGRPAILLAGTDSSPDNGGAGNTNNAAGAAFTLTSNLAANRQLTLFASEQVGDATKFGFRFILGGPLPIIDGVNGAVSGYGSLILGQEASQVGFGWPYLTGPASLRGQVHVKAGDSARPGVVIRSAGAPALIVEDSAGASLAWFEAAGGLRLAQIPDTAAGVGCLYFSTTANKLAFKDGGGVVHPLT